MYLSSFVIFWYCSSSSHVASPSGANWLKKIQRHARMWQMSRDENKKKMILSNPLPILKISAVIFSKLLDYFSILIILSSLVSLTSLYRRPILVILIISLIFAELSLDLII